MPAHVLAMIRTVDGVVDAEGWLGYAIDDTRPPDHQPMP
jgi:hypothetical protein